MNETIGNGPEDTSRESVPLIVVEESAICEKSRSKPVRPVGWRELICLLLMVILADITLYGVAGFAGPAVFFALLPVPLWWGAADRHLNVRTLVAVLLIWGVAIRLVWCATGMAVVAGIVLTGCVSLAIAGGALSVGEILRLLAGLPFSSMMGLLAYDRWIRICFKRWLHWPALGKIMQFALPPVMGLIFLGIFILANPDLVNWVAVEISSLFESIDQWIGHLIDSPWRIVFWIGAGWISVGLLRPILPAVSEAPPATTAFDGNDIQNELFPAFRNTLSVLIVLFAGYLVFEFWTMWTRTFPPDFYYAGYAHEGAFWLTVALGLATLLLSVIFRGTIWRDERLPLMRWLAMIWSAENLLLSAAVFNRLFIYINFNGMTRMRVVGLIGTATVVAGLILVVVKIWRQRHFAWVIRHQLITLALAIYLYAILPVDAFVVAYDVRQILSGNPKPSVQLAHHQTSLEGKLQMFPLLNCSDTIIRDGVAELLTNTWNQLQQNSTSDWTAYQIAAEQFQQHVLESRSQPEQIVFEEGAWQRFRDYSFQWY